MRLAIDRSDALNNYWNLYLGTSTAVLGLMATGKSFTRSPSFKVARAVAFVLFAYVNRDAILYLRTARLSLLDIAREDRPGRVALLDGLAPASVGYDLAVHLVLDALVVLAIWLVPWGALRIGRSPPGAE